MGRSPGNLHSPDEDPTQRSRPKENASSGKNLESTTAGQGTSEGKALYFCNYCHKDITGKTRIKCCICADFDLCIECFSVGAEVQPHKSNHPYRVMDNLCFPIICPDWNADEEILLLEGVEMYGLGNWTEIAEHVGTKRKEQCISHYTDVFMNSSRFPLPDMSLVGKDKKELLAMAKGHSEEKKVKDARNADSGPRSSGAKVAAAAANKKPNITRVKDGLIVKVEDPQSVRSFRGKKKPEYDDDVEQLLADMEFKDEDTEEERESKLRLLRIYSKRF